MAELSLQQCFNHAGREAAARCLECGRFFCRECVTEHGGRLLCGHCLAGVGRTEKKTGGLLKGCLRAAAALLSFVLAWLLFYGFGWVLHLFLTASEKSS